MRLKYWNGDTHAEALLSVLPRGYNIKVTDDSNDTLYRCDVDFQGFYFVEGVEIPKEFTSIERYSTDIMKYTLTKMSEDYKEPDRFGEVLSVHSVNIRSGLTYGFHIVESKPAFRMDMHTSPFCGEFVSTFCGEFAKEYTFLNGSSYIAAAKEIMYNTLDDMN